MFRDGLVSKATIYRAVLCATIILLPVLAEAQTVRPFPPLLIPLEPPEALPASGTQGGYFFNLRPLGADFGRTLADHGIYLIARNLTEGIVNASGGVKQGTSFEAYSAVGFDLDMDRVAGIPHGAVHFLVSDLAGQPYAGYSGSTYLNNRLFAGDGPGLHLNEFSYEQGLFDDRLNLRLGRVPA
jgi:porin